MCKLRARKNSLSAFNSEPENRRTDPEIGNSKDRECFTGRVTNHLSRRGTPMLAVIANANTDSNRELFRAAGHRG
jgi:hypothetical protein